MRKEVSFSEHEVDVQAIPRANDSAIEGSKRTASGSDSDANLAMSEAVDNDNDNENYIDNVDDDPNLRFARATGKLVFDSPELNSIINKIANTQALEGAGVPLAESAMQKKAL